MHVEKVTAMLAGYISTGSRWWLAVGNSEERPSFDELAAELEKVLSTMVGYLELNMELVAITEDEHSKQFKVYVQSMITSTRSKSRGNFPRPLLRRLP